MGISSILLILVGILNIVILFLTISGSRARRRLQEQYPPIGEMVDMGGYQMHMLVRGKGSQAVVFDSGQGAGMLAWGTVPGELAADTQVICYDRAGLGWSEASPQRRSTAVMVDELRTLLQKAGIPRPYILVGHSTGGMNCRYYAYQYPQEVAGLVLDDPAHEDQFSPEPIQKVMKQMQWMRPVMVAARRLSFWVGLPARRLENNPDQAIRSDPILGAHPNLPADLSRAYLATNAFNPANISAATAELKDLPQTWEQLRGARERGLDDLPLIVINHGVPAPMMTPELTSLMEETFVRLSEEVIASSTRGKRIVAEGSGHNIPLDRPDVVVQAVRQVLAEVR